MNYRGEEIGGVFVWLPGDFPMSDLLAVVEQLSDAGICVPGYIPPPVGLYHPHGFLFEHLVGETSTVLLPDRNVISRLARLAQGFELRDDEQFRLAAGLLAFSQCLDILVEPSIAFHELAHKNGNEEAHNELAWFRAADSARSTDLFDLALGRQYGLAGHYRPIDATDAVDLAKPIRSWRRNYVIALKMVELEQSVIARPVERVLSLLDWMRDDFVFGGPASLLASVYFAPKSPPKKRVFKDKNSADREAAIAGVRNAAWDLTHLSEFVRRVDTEGHEGKTRYLFASFDKHLRSIAKLLIEHGTDRSEEGALAAALSQWWDRRDAESIVSRLRANIARIRSPEWRAKEAPWPDYVGHLIEKGEQRVREVVPKV